MDENEIAKKLVHLVRKNRPEAVYINANEVLDTENGRSTCTYLLEAAGFKRIYLSIGIVEVDMHGGKRPINFTYRLKVATDKSTEVNTRATGWLDCMLRFTLTKLEDDRWNDEQLETWIIREIDRCRPFEPIKLSAYGEELYPITAQPAFPMPQNYLVDQPKDQSPMGQEVGWHWVCRRMIKRYEVSETHSALHCRECGLRVVIPKEITTYGELRLFMETTPEHCEPKPWYT